MDLDQFTLLYRVRKTVLQMLKDRGFAISEKKLLQLKEEFVANYNGSRESLNMMVNKSKVAGAEAGFEQDKIFVFFPENDKLSLEILVQICKMMVEHTVLRAIVIVKGTTQISKRVIIKLN